MAEANKTRATSRGQAAVQAFTDNWQLCAQLVIFRYCGNFPVSFWSCRWDYQKRWPAVSHVVWEILLRLFLRWDGGLAIDLLCLWKLSAESGTSWGCRSWVTILFLEGVGWMRFFLCDHMDLRPVFVPSMSTGDEFSILDSIRFARVIFWTCDYDKLYVFMYRWRQDSEAGRMTEKEMMIDVGAAAESVGTSSDAPLYAIESLCMRCRENVSVTLGLDLDIWFHA